MKKSKFSDSQIMDALKRVEVGLPVPDLCREVGISTATFYKWRAKFAGMDTIDDGSHEGARRGESAIKKMYIEEKLKAEIAAEYFEKNNAAVSSPRDGQRGGGPARRQHSAGLPCVHGLRELLPLRSQAQCRVLADRRLAAALDGPQPQQWLWAVLLVSAQRQGLQMETQTHLQDLPRAGAEPAHQATQAAGA